MVKRPTSKDNVSDALILMGLFFVVGSVLGFPFSRHLNLDEDTGWLPGPIMQLTAFNPYRAMPIGILLIIASLILRRGNRRRSASNGEGDGIENR